MNPLAPSSSLPDSSRPARLRLLVVEDNPIDRMALQRYCAAHEPTIDLVAATTLMEARESLRQHRFEVILVDHALPDGTGFDLFAFARDTPIILMTSTDNLPLAVRALRAGAADHLVKDPERAYLDLLSHTVHRAVHHRLTRCALRQAQSRIQELLEFLPAAAFAINNHGVITFRNTHLDKLLLHAPAVGEHAESFFARFAIRTPNGHPVSVAECWRKLTAPAAAPSCELIIETAPNRSVHVLGYSNPMFDELGLPNGFVVLWIDVTEMRRLEAHLHHARRLESLGTLTGGMAHEFNNLLAAILGNLQLAEMDIAASHPAQSSLRQAVESSRRARDLVARLLNFSRRAQQSVVPTALAPLVEDATRLLQPCLSRNITLQVDLNPTPIVLCSPDDLIQILLQLGLNAAEAIKQQPGQIRFSLRHTPVVAQADLARPGVTPRHTVQLAVTDTGTGISPQILERLFEPFFTTPEPGRGAGHGLAEVYGATTRSGGAVAVTSSPGAGTTVTLYLADAPAPDPRLDRDSLPPLEQDRSSS